MALNSGFEYHATIAASGPRRTVLEHLVREHSHSSRDEWRKHIAEGRVVVDGKVADPDQLLAAGQVLTWRRPPWNEPDVPLEFDVVYEDAHLVAVDKPAGLPTLPGAGYLEGTLLHLVRQRFGDASAVHRLGRFTSGLVLFGRTPEARRGLAAAWRDQRVHKVYRALATGRPERDAFAVEVPIAPVPHLLLGRIHAAHALGRASLSRVRVLERRRDHFLAEVVIVTGRPHQVRIHLAAAGHPLVGDPIYRCGGQPMEDCRALPGDPGYLLRATEIRLDHPVSGAPLVLVAPAGKAPAVLSGVHCRSRKSG